MHKLIKFLIFFEKFISFNFLGSHLAKHTDKNIQKLKLLTF